MANTKHTPDAQLPLPDHKRQPVTRGGRHTTRQPKYELILIDKANRYERTRVGVAWESEEGYISIKLGLGVVLTTQSTQDHYLSMYLTQEKDSSEG